MWSVTGAGFCTLFPLFSVKVIALLTSNTLEQFRLFYINETTTARTTLRLALLLQSCLGYINLYCSSRYCCSILVLCSIPLKERTTIYMPILLLMEIWCYYSGYIMNFLVHVFWNTAWDFAGWMYTLITWNGIGGS